MGDIGRILELIGAAPVPTDQPQLISLGGPVPPPEDPEPPEPVPIPFVAELGIEGALREIQRRQDLADLGGKRGPLEALPIAAAVGAGEKFVPPEIRIPQSDLAVPKAPTLADEIRNLQVDPLTQQGLEERGRPSVERFDPNLPRIQEPSIAADVLHSFRTGEPARSPLAQGFATMLEMFPGTEAYADVRDLFNGFSDGDPTLAAIGGVGLALPVGGSFIKSLVDASKASRFVGPPMPDAMRIERNLLAAERRQFTKANTAAEVTRIFKELPSPEVLSSAALAGQVKRGWYRRSAEALQETFGEDTPRFVAALAALSPQNSVETNLLNTLNVWKNWTAAGRPTSDAAIRAIMGESVQSQPLSNMAAVTLRAKKKAALKNFGIRITARTPAGIRKQLAEKLTDDQLRDLAVLPAWVNNTIRALRSTDPADLVLSGPKVDSFMRNLLDDTGAVTLDTWMAKLARIDQALLGGSLNLSAKAKKLAKETGQVQLKGLSEGGTPGKSGAYLAYTARLRETAEELTRLTGDKWTPEEVQETVWSWAYALSELVGEGGAAAKRGELRQLISQVTDDLIADVPDFSGLLNQEANRAILESAGLSAPALRAATSPASSALRSVSEAVPRTGTEAAQAAGRSGRAGAQPRLEDLEELARNIELHAADDLAVRKKPVKKKRKKKTP